VILDGENTTGKDSIACAYGGFAGTVKVKLHSSPGTVVAGTPLELVAGGTVKQSSGSAGTVLVAQALETGAANELIEAALMRPVTVPTSIDDDSVTAAKLAADAVTTAKILDANVTAAKLAATLDVSGKTLTLPSPQVIDLKRTVTVDADGATLTAASSGRVITNTGAVAEATFKLPAAAAGLEFVFFVGAAQELRIDPDGSETIALPSTGVQCAAGKYISADAVGEWVHIVAIGTGAWQVIGYAGTWTAEG